jgi:hypothetical protein
VPDAGGEGEESGGYPGVDACHGPSAVVFEAELAFEGVENGFDPLPDAAEFAESRFLVLAVRADQVRVEVLGDEPFEVAAGETFVPEDDLPGADEVVVVFDQGLGDLAFTDLRISSSGALRSAVGMENLAASPPPLGCLVLSEALNQTWCVCFGRPRSVYGAGEPVD